MGVAFGGAFKIPMICKLQMPDPMPYSTNCNVSACWEEEPNSNSPTSSEPVANNYETEGVPTSNLEEQMSNANSISEEVPINNNEQTNNEDFDPMAGL